MGRGLFWEGWNIIRIEIVCIHYDVDSVSSSNLETSLRKRNRWTEENRMIGMKENGSMIELEDIRKTRQDS